MVPIGSTIHFGPPRKKTARKKQKNNPKNCVVLPGQVHLKERTWNSGRKKSEGFPIIIQISTQKRKYHNPVEKMKREGDRAEERRVTGLRKWGWQPCEGPQHRAGSALKLPGEFGLIHPMFLLPAMEHRPSHGLMELAWRLQQNPHSLCGNCAKNASWISDHLREFGGATQLIAAPPFPAAQSSALGTHINILPLSWLLGIFISKCLFFLNTIHGLSVFRACLDPTRSRLLLMKFFLWWHCRNSSSGKKSYCGSCSTVLSPNCSELGLVRAHPDEFPGSLEGLLDLFHKYSWGKANKYVLGLMDWSFRSLSVKGLLIKMVQTRLEHLFCGSVWIKMHSQTSLAAPLYGEKTGGKGSKLIPDIWNIAGTLRDKLVQLYNDFFFHTYLLKLRKCLKVFMAAPELSEYLHWGWFRFIFYLYGIFFPLPYNLFMVPTTFSWSSEI